MDGSRRISGQWHREGNMVHVNLALILFEEEDHHIAFCPALDLSASGDSDREAIASFKVTLSEYLLYTTQKGTLIDDLKAHGWAIETSNEPPMAPPDLSYLLSVNKDFNRVFNTRDFRKINHMVNMPAIA